MAVPVPCSFWKKRQVAIDIRRLVSCRNIDVDHDHIQHKKPRSTTKASLRCQSPFEYLHMRYNKMLRAKKKNPYEIDNDCRCVWICKNK
jgi:hypothetical protein